MAKRKNKKGMGLTDFFSILAIALILVVMYSLLKIFVGQSTFELKGESSRVENIISTIGILRTPINIDGIDANIAELIAVSEFDSSKRTLLEKNLIELMDNSFGTSRCSVICIDENKIESSGCGTFQIYECPLDAVVISSYDKNIIRVAFAYDVKPLSPVRIP